MKKTPQKVEILLIEGTPFGMRFADIKNKTCRAFVCPRSSLKNLLQRNEMEKAGVYFLIDRDTTQVYIGEADILNDRLPQHSDKEWWTEVVAFVAQDDSLDKASVRYCESVLVQKAKQAKQYTLTNGNVPAIKNLSEANKAVMDEFIEQIIFLLSVLGYKIIYSTDQQEDTNFPTLFIKVASENLVARGRETDKGFIVYEGSQARKQASATYENSDSNRRQELIQKGVLKTDPSSNHLVFSQDFVFTSSSSAAATILGRSANGRTEWKTETGKPLKEIQI